MNYYKFLRGFDLEYFLLFSPFKVSLSCSILTQSLLNKDVQSVEDMYNDMIVSSSKFTLLLQLLQMIDNGQGVDVRGIPNKSMVKHLKKLFLSLKIKQNESGVFWLPPLGQRTLDIIGPVLCLHLKTRDSNLGNQDNLPTGDQFSVSDPELARSEVGTDAARMTDSLGKEDSPCPPRRR